MRLEGRSVLVTGGAQGMGLAIARRFAEEGADLVLLDVEGETLAAAVASLASAGPGRIEHVVGDVSRRADVRGAVERATGTYGRLDALVAQAGTADIGPLLDVDDPTWQRLIEVNLTGLFYSVQEAARAMRPGGAIVATSSTNAYFVEAHTVPYSTTKGGVVTFVRAAALDLAEHGIRINAICPGIIRTRLSAVLTEDPVAGPQYLKKIPLGRWGEPRDIAQTALWLASDESSYMTGQALTVDGGVTLGVALDVQDGALPGLAPADGDDG
jgi:NAD(P)-dependent dehydrogenase (short-subunit alcohol dehydrogenase family)